MADSAIEWTNKTWNPVTGCSKVSQGCKNCYAEREWVRLSHNPKQPDYFGRGFTDVACHEHRLRQPLSYPDGTLCFVNSMSDLFHDAVPDAFIDQVFAVMALARQATFQVLTKRSARMLNYVQRLCHEMGRLAQPACDISGSPCAAHVEDSDWPIPNVWLGVSVEDADTFRERVLLLRQVPAAVRFISYEPALGPIGKWLDLLGCKCGDFKRQHENGVGRCQMPDDLAHGCEPCQRYDGIDWVICGGESGPHARPMHPDWAREVRDACARSGIPFFFKQWGEWAPGDHPAKRREWQTLISRDGFKPNAELSADDPAVALMHRMGKKAAGDLLDGRQHHEYPSSVVGRPSAEVQA